VNNHEKNLFERIIDLVPLGLSWQELIPYLLQLGIFAYVLFAVYIRIRGSQAERILTGIFISFIPLILLFYALDLRILIKIFELLLPALSTALIVLFAPELRRFLHNLGRDSFSWLNILPWLKDHPASQPPTQSNKQIVGEILRAVETCSQNKIGALIVIDNIRSDRLYVNSGRRLDAVISAELIINIFYPRSPLHDGAVLIRNKKIVAAAVILPITENPKLNPWQYGTRHRAALGLSEASISAFCIIVSEETGYISMAESGKLSKVNSLENLSKTLKEKLNS